MPGLNASLNIALSGLQANQAALSAVGHNIANVNTPNYSRQRAVLASNGAQPFGNLEFGTGVSLVSIVGVRDRFLEMQVIQASSRESGANVRYSGVEGISSMFMEDGESSLSALTTRFFQGFQELSSRPEDNAVRTNVLGRAGNLIDGLKSRYSLLADQRMQADRSIGSTIQEINTLTTEISKLNGRIATELQTGTQSDARDQRQTLAVKLGELIGVQVFEDSQGQLQITVDSGSAVLVNGTTAYQLQGVPDAAYENLLRVETVTGMGVATDITKSVKEGSLGGYLDLRDNVLVGMQQNLDQLAAGIASNVNLIHRGGFGLDGATTGLDFFAGAVPNGANGLPTNVDPAQNYKGMVNAMSLNAALVADPKAIAAANVANAPGNNEMAKALANLQVSGNTVDTNGDGVGDSGPYTSFIAVLANEIGTQAQSFQSRSTSDENLLVALENQRNRASGVDLDEEATNMMTFQRGYQAAARFVSIINQLTDQLVNQFAR